MHDKNKLKFYMNNPCEVIREIGSEFSEVRVYPKYIDEGTSGGDWCFGCQAGHLDGTPNHHDCDKYQEIIDYINETESSMIVVVENRLLQDDPVEFKSWSEVRRRTIELREKGRAIIAENIELTSQIAKRTKLLSEIKEDINRENLKLESLIDKSDSIRYEISALCERADSLRDSVSVGSVKVSISGSRVREMIKARIILDALESGGVDNWEWYSESMPDGDIDELVQNEIESLTVKGF